MADDFDPDAYLTSKRRPAPRAAGDDFDPDRYIVARRAAELEREGFKQDPGGGWTRPAPKRHADPTMGPRYEPGSMNYRMDPEGAAFFAGTPEEAREALG